ncbi:sulfotransferase family 2 domain-containing protein [Pseudalkalibacillus berkeleyi]|uniref:Sulfotransferase family protein n=1 Tax=Pseudalkalibacillus berkeleyi TaxID=1069813 RepID=A0ABS9GUW8_9BACL|nr:sulfotransferase family 2 domain-containing protein [Pseudalkalibacillus berkeleyi]MCF6136637.1 sulfotransferase family protein [Pseudalkalibacillus berkeleyi]
MSESNPNRHIIARKLITPPIPLFAKNFPIIFFWNPKCGCTSLIKWFFFQQGLLQKATDYSPIIHSYRLNVIEKQNNHTQNIIEHLLSGDKDVYKLVRNPYKRAVSSFFHAIMNKNIMDSIAPGVKNGISFKEFLYRLKENGVERGKVNAHMVQQYVNGEELFLNKYIQLENFVTSIRTIEKQYNLSSSPINSLIKSPHHITQKMNESDNRTYPDVKMSIESINQPLPPYENLYDQEAMDLVKTIYKMDFERYGYNQNFIVLK